MFYWHQLEEVGFHDPCSSQGFQALEKKRKTKEFHNIWLWNNKKEKRFVPGTFISANISTPKAQINNKQQALKMEALVSSAKCHGFVYFEEYLRPI